MEEGCFYIVRNHRDRSEDPLDPVRNENAKLLVWFVNCPNEDGLSPKCWSAEIFVPLVKGRNNARQVAGYIVIGRTRGILTKNLPCSSNIPNIIV